MNQIIVKTPRIGVIVLFMLAVAAKKVAAEPISLTQAARLIGVIGSKEGPVRPEKIRDALQNISDRLPELQTEEMCRYLGDVLATPVDANDCRRTVQQISQRNLNRLTGEISTPPDPVVRFVVRRFLLQFRHNTKSRHKILDDQAFWLSSKQLSEMGLRGGLQEDHNFNSKFLGTANWIFFYVGADYDPLYGEGEVFVSSEYAEEQGLIFPFVMSVDQLLRVGKITHPNLAARAYAILQKTHLEDPDQEYLEVSDLLVPIRHSLKEFLFTPQDFEKALVLAITINLRARPPRERWWLRSRLLSPIYGHRVMQDLQEESLRALGMPFRFEMRIPVAIPQKALSKTCSRLLW